MKIESMNFYIQLILFPGISIFGLVISFIKKDISPMPVFYGMSLLLRAVFSLVCNVYGKGHWYSKKERVLDGLVFIILGVVGEIEIIQYLRTKI